MTRAASPIKTKSIANWFGSNRMLAATVGQRLKGCEWVGIPFCGGCSEIPFIQTRSGVASDLHRHLINLARCIRHPAGREHLARMLSATLFHPDELEAAQHRCRERETRLWGPATIFDLTAFDDESSSRGVDHDLGWAYDYALCTWMTAGGRSGTAKEFDQSMSFRWNAGGGDSCTRLRSFTESIDGFFAAFARWNFVVLDAFAFLADCHDRAGHGLYVDAPWPDDGDSYKHSFTAALQRRLAKELLRFQKTRIVVRYGDHPLIRELYRVGDGWEWIEQTSRAQTNEDKAEVLIVRNARAGAGGGA